MGKQTKFFRFFSRSVFLAVPVLISGCFGNYYVVNPVLESTGIESIDSDFFIRNEQRINTEGKAFQAALAAAKTNKAARNELLGKILLLSDQVCEQHKGEILGGAATVNVALGSATTIFSSIGTVIGAESAKAGLSAAAAITNSGRSLVNDEVYQHAFVISIVKAIEDDRERKRRVLYSSLDKEVTEYSIIHGLVDVNEYHHACSFLNGLKLVSESVGNRRATKAELREEVEYLKSQIQYNQENKLSIDTLQKELDQMQQKYVDANY